MRQQKNSFASEKRLVAKLHRNEKRSYFLEQKGALTKTLSYFIHFLLNFDIWSPKPPQRFLGSLFLVASQQPATGLWHKYHHYHHEGRRSDTCNGGPTPIELVTNHVRHKNASDDSDLVESSECATKTTRGRLGDIDLRRNFKD